MEFIESQPGGFAKSSDLASYFGLTSQRAISAAKELLGSDFVIIRKSIARKYYTPQSLQRARPELIEFIESQPGGFAKSSDLVGYFRIKSLSTAVKDAKELLGKNLVLIGKSNTRKYYTSQSLQRAKQELIEFIESQPGGFVKSSDLASYFRLTLQSAVNAATDLLGKDFVPIGKGLGSAPVKYYTPQSFQRARQELMEFIDRQPLGFAKSGDLASYFGLKRSRSAVIAAKNLLGKNLVLIGKSNTRKYYTLMEFIESQPGGFAKSSDLASYFGLTSQRAISAAKELLGKDNLIPFGKGSATKYYTSQSSQRAVKCKRNRITQNLRRYNPKPQRQIIRYRKPRPLTREERRLKAIELYLRGVLKYRIIEQLGVSGRTLNTWLADVAYIDPRREQARELYQQGVGIRRILKKLHVGPILLTRWLSDLLPDVDPRIEQARELYQQGMSKNLIKRKLRVSQVALNQWLADLIPEVDPRIEQARELYRDGASKAQIQDQLHVGRPLLNRWLVDLLPDILDVDPRMEQARELHQQGARRDQILKRLHVSRPVLSGWLADLIPDVDPRIEQARELYQQGVSKNQIMKRLHASQRTLGKWLTNHRYNPRYNPQPSRQVIRYKKPRPMSEMTQEEKRIKARELYQQGVSIREVKRRLRAGEAAIKKWIADLVPEVDPRIEQAREFYLQGASINDIIHRFQAASSTIKKWIAGLEPPKDPRIEQARELYQQGASIAEIKRRLRVGYKTLKKWLTDLEPPKDPRIKQARELYRKGVAIREISSRLQASRETIIKWIADLDPPEDPRKEQARELYQQGTSIAEIKRCLRTDPRRIKKWIADLDPPEDPRRGQARKLYRQGVGIVEISHRLRVGHRKVNKWIADLIPDQN
jgi:transposase